MRSHMRRFNITPEDRAQMQIEQSNQCAICLKVKKLVVDHCHETGKVRGLLCQSCNTGLGRLGDNLEGIMVAARYLQGHCAIIKV